MVDSGVDLQHADIDGNIWVNPGETGGDGIDNDGNGRVDDVNGWDFFSGDNNPDDVFGHGTQVAGVIAAEGNNGQGIAGVSWRNKIIPVRIGNTAPDEAAVINGIDYINDLRLDEGINVRVMNISLSIPGSTDLSNAIEAARLNGIIVTVAAGNGGIDGIGDDIDISPVYPAAYTHDNIITVAASNQTDGRPTFSNFGDVSVDLAAPGDDIRTLANGGGTVTSDGTSFAAPMVAGAAALVFAMKPDLTYTQVRNAILNNVDALAAFSGLVATGGRLNLESALDDFLGASKTFIGDGNTGPRADDVLIRPKPGDSTKTQIMLYQGGYRVFTELDNTSSKRIDVYGLGLGDVLTVNSGVLNKMYAGGSEGDDNFNATNATGSVTLSGEAGHDTLTGGSNADSIEGGSGNDLLTGNAGADILNGVNNDDTMYGGADNDSLYGGNGIDRFVGNDGDDWFYGRNSDTDNGFFGGNGFDHAQIDSTDDDVPANFSSIEQLLP